LVQAANLLQQRTAERDHAEQQIAHVASFPELDPNPIFEADLEGKITYANPAARKLFPNLLEYGVNHPLLTEWAAVVARFTSGDEQLIVGELKARGKVFHQVNYYRRELRRVRAYFTDITERKRAEEALLRSEKLNAVGRMAATIAHEINNPLAAVTNSLFLANTVENLPEAACHYLEMADEELKRVAHITRQSLGFYRESSAPAPTSVTAVLDSAVDLLKSKITAKHAIIEKQWDGDVQVTAVGGELRQVFTNLLSNSLDAIEEEGVIKLRVSTGSGFKHGGKCIRVTVADNGQGIHPLALMHIFEPLFTTKQSTGSGLGLWVCKQIIDKHKGSIQVRSGTNRERRGTTFSVLIPVNAEPATKTRAAAAT
jgi:signal transduction histidine kinase